MNNVGKIFLLAVIFIASPMLMASDEYVRPEKIIMLWDYIGRRGDNLRPERKIVHRGLDVISPTWFSLRNARGDVSSLADKGYVQWAHDNSIKVWAIFENSSNGPLSFRALSNSESRKRMLEQIIGFVREFNLDGINVDFEALQTNTGGHFEEFIVELYQLLKPMGVVLSVDIPFPPQGVEKIYDISYIANNSDYLVMMAYDQHHERSETPGPVAAISWVKQGIEDALNYVKNGKVILGIPFYTRVWIENRLGRSSGSRSELKGMKEAYDLFKSRSTVWKREEATEQIYSEYTEGQNKHMTWLEDEHSISLKLDVIVDYNLAGLSAWRRGWEWDETWDLINAYFE